MNQFKLNFFLWVSFSSDISTIGGSFVWQSRSEELFKICLNYQNYKIIYKYIVETNLLNWLIYYRIYLWLLWLLLLLIFSKPNWNKLIVKRNCYIVTRNFWQFLVISGIFQSCRKSTDLHHKEFCALSMSTNLPDRLIRNIMIILFILYQSFIIIIFYLYYINLCNFII